MSVTSSSRMAISSAMASTLSPGSKRWPSRAGFASVARRTSRCATALRSPSTISASSRSRTSQDPCAPIVSLTALPVGAPQLMPAREDEGAFAFGLFRLIPARRMLLDDGKPLRLGSRAFDILLALVARAGETISRDRLIAAAWPDTVVDEGALRVHVAALRKALGDGRAGKRYIVNNPGRGYTFVTPVTREHPHLAPATPTGETAANNLPVPLTRIVGRDEIIAALRVQLAQRRLLTIVGPGGIGKTTVAIAIAEAA